MASQIYSRYVPPGKKPAQASQPSANHHLLTTQNDASATYARYVPPSKLKPPAVSTASTMPTITPTASPSVSKRHHEDLGDPTGQPKPKRTKTPKNEEEAAKSRSSEPTPRKKGAKLSIREITPDTNNETPPSVQNNTHASDQRLESLAETEDSRHKNLMGKREKSLKKSKRLAEGTAKELGPESLEEAPEEEPLQDLGPLPQPEPLPELPALNIPSSLPPWLASPIRVSPTATAQFVDLGVPQNAINILAEKGFKEAFAVQAASLPLLLPGPAQMPGDVLVSAATGTGKTLAYVLPMIEELSRNTTTKLRALVVVPTRELVVQSQHVSEICASAFATGSRRRVKIGTALGNENFKAEQSSLMENDLIFDPKAYSAELEQLNSQWDSSGEDNEADSGVILEKTLPVSRLSGHVANPAPKVDILICTPGRLVEHMKSTPGFSLQHVKWLVVDEADKLLDQSFQQWLNVVMPALQAENQIARCKSCHVRKVILSATLTTDIGELNALKLYRPKLVVLEGSSFSGGILKRQPDLQAHALPSLLVEAAIKIDEEAIKPWYLLELLRRENLLDRTEGPKSPGRDSSDSSSISDTSDSDAEDSGSSVTSRNSPEANQNQSSPSAAPRGVLVFTKSNETAVRLGRLIALLEPKFSSMLATLTSTTRSSARRASLKGFEFGKLSILIASDLVSRGLDIANLAHVVNYDIPTSIASYVHRVGRTARAGKAGHAWTLFTGTEAWWFWNEIARSTAIERDPSSKISRVNISTSQLNEEQRAGYEAALGALQLEATGSKSQSPTS